MTELAAFVLICLSIIGLMVGWVVKHKTPIPNDAIPWINTFLGALLGLLLPWVSVWNASIAMGGGATSAHSLAKKSPEAYVKALGEIRRMIRWIQKNRGEDVQRNGEG